MNSLISVLFIFLSSLTWAGPTQTPSDSEYLMKDYHVDLKSKELSIRFEENKSTRNNCQAYVQRFEYLRTQESLMLEIKPVEPCYYDRGGKRKAYFKWTLPLNQLLDKELKLFVNGKLTSTLWVKESL